MAVVHEGRIRVLSVAVVYSPIIYKSSKMLIDKGKRLRNPIKPIIIAGQDIYPLDCMDGFKLLGDESVDHVSTSPPYNLGGFHADRKIRAYHGGFSDDMLEDDYRAFIKGVIRECFRVLKPDGSFFINMKTRIKDGVSVPPYWILQDNPFYLKQEIIWHYPSTANVDKVRFFPLFEYVFWFIKDLKNFKFNNEWALIGNVWHISHIKDRNETKIESNARTIQHPAPFSTQISQTMVLSTTHEGDVVLDPFLGSGTTLKVCRHYKRKGIGFEKYYAEYKPLIKKRITSGDFPPSLLELKRAKKNQSRAKNRRLDQFF
ncbi:MAG: DNA-methyltransferase [Promethearchaeota archaeon]